MCTPAQAAAFGKEDGTRADSSKKQLGKFEFCKGMSLFAKIQDSYNSEFNKATSEILIKGDWKFEYYNQKFEKITEDNYREALLITGNNKKQFNKMTLPKDADYCRAEFIVPAEIKSIVR